MLLGRAFCRLLTIYTNRGSNTQDAEVHSCRRQRRRAAVAAQAAAPAAPASSATPPGRGADAHRARPVELAADAGAAGARADDPRRRAPRRRQAQRSGDRRAARRLARSGARGVPRARGVGPRPPREEPRRVRAPDRRSRKPTRSTSCAPCSTSSSAGGVAQNGDARTRSRALRARVDRMERAAAQAATSTPIIAANLDVPRPAGRARRQREAARACIAGSSTSCTSSATRRSRRAARCPVSTREHREIVERIAAGQPAAAGRALYDHVMASRERMHRTHAAPPPPRRKPNAPRRTARKSR